MTLPRFPVGTRVRVVGNDDLLAGCEATVVRAVPLSVGVDYLVRLEEARHPLREHWRSSDELEAAS